MNELKQYREQLDLIDYKIIKLFEKRMAVIKDVAIYKKANNLAIYDKTREMIMLEKNINKFDNDELRKYYKIILEAYLEASKQYQNDLIHKK